MSQSSSTVTENGNHRPLNISIEDDPNGGDAAFFDPSNPEFASARQPKKKRRGWKRKLFTWALVLLLIVGGIGALYLVTKVNRVPVKVDAESRRSASLLNGEPVMTTTENGLSAEAINIARQAIGNDPARAGANTSPTPSASPGASPVPTVTPYNGRDLSFTVGSPAYLQTNAAENQNAQDVKTQAVTEQAKAGTTSPAMAQSRANTTQTLFVEDVIAKPATPLVNLANPVEKKSPPVEVTKTSASVVPPFGTLLPVRTQGVIFTLRNNSYARLELIRDAAGTGWSLPKGTLLVGRVSGSEQDRALINVIGYIDPHENRLVKMAGEVLGADGATGLPGKPIGADRNRLKETLRKIASSGMQVAGTMAGALGRGTVVIDSAGYSGFDPFADERRRTGSGDDKKAFVKVAAGQAAYVMVADLPKSVPAVDAPGEDDFVRMAGSLSDREVMELILFGTPDELRAALPAMSDEQRRLALKSLAAKREEK